MKCTLGHYLSKYGFKAKAKKRLRWIFQPSTAISTNHYAVSAGFLSLIEISVALSVVSATMFYTV